MIEKRDEAVRSSGFAELDEVMQLADELLSCFGKILSIVVRMVTKENLVTYGGITADLSEAQ
jgi:hypothetical protein